MIKVTAESLFASLGPLMLMTFRVRLKKDKAKSKIDLEKLRDPDVACTFQTIKGGKFAPFIGLRGHDMNIHTMITTYKTEITEKQVIYSG